MQIGKDRRAVTSGEHTLTEAQFNQLLSVIQNINDLALFQLAVTTGIRREDIVSLFWDNIHLDSGKIEFLERKKRRIHTVYIPDKMVQTLRILKNENHNSVYLFDGKSEMKYGQGHITGKTAYNKYQKYLVKAGIQKESDRRPFHSLRATCIKFCQRKGWSAEETAKHVGDKIQTIQEHYVTPTDGEMSETSRNKPLL